MVSVQQVALAVIDSHLPIVIQHRSMSKITVVPLIAAVVRQCYGIDGTQGQLYRRIGQNDNLIGRIPLAEFDQGDRSLIFYFD